jgi:ABC-type antimicrobial peptide transport system permease subunit
VKITPKLRAISAGTLCVIFAAGLFAGGVTHYSYAMQFRELPNAPPSALHLLGTDGLGRDLFARLLYGTRISFLLAPAAALISTLSPASWRGCGTACGWCENPRCRRRSVNGSAITLRFVGAPRRPAT